MSRPLPELIDPLRLSGKGSVLQGPLAIKRMSRLQEVLCQTEDPKNDSEVTIDFSFGVDQGNQANVSGLIDVALWIPCQRCMQPMRWCKQIKIRLAFVKSELEADKLPSRYEPYFLTKSLTKSLTKGLTKDSVNISADSVQDDMHSLHEMAESEIILALPQEAKHPVDECSIDARYESRGDNNSYNGSHSLDADSSEPSRPNPFAVLKQMKNKD